MKIEVLGPGCAKCKQAFATVAEFVQKRGLPHEVVKVESLETMMAYGVMTTPAIAIDGKVVLRGKAPSEADLEKILG